MEHTFTFDDSDLAVLNYILANSPVALFAAKVNQQIAASQEAMTTPKESPPAEPSNG